MDKVTFQVKPYRFINPDWFCINYPWCFGQMTHKCVENIKPAWRQHRHVTNTLIEMIWINKIFVCFKCQSRKTRFSVTCTQVGHQTQKIHPSTSAPTETDVVTLLCLLFLLVKVSVKLLMKLSINWELYQKTAFVCSSAAHHATPPPPLRATTEINSQPGEH